MPRYFIYGKIDKTELNKRKRKGNLTLRPGQGPPNLAGPAHPRTPCLLPHHRAKQVGGGKRDVGCHLDEERLVGHPFAPKLATQLPLAPHALPPPLVLRLPPR